ncbi:hypothetical protein BGZ63DRAFT_399548 [Mariannaea sp. PMI_226]|nr:hypothetical protein BGZ63DRAFT_399548 [Mariannaea sp. PMI_226]
MTTTLPPDPYKTLGVAHDAQIPEIRSAHRKLVLKCHPDKVQDPTLKAQKQDEFQQVQQAYELLSNEKERQRYDDQVRLAELRRQMHAKANSSAPRAFKVEIRTPEPQASSFKSTSGTPPSAKFSRSYEAPPNTRIFEEPPFVVRREKSYPDKPSKKEERDRAERTDKERERDRRKKAKEQEEYLREKARKAEKKARDKERKRSDEEKKRHAEPYIEDDVFEKLPVREKKKSSKKHEEKRDRSSHREDPAAPAPLVAQKEKENHQINEAHAYIKSKNPRFKNLPAAPTPPIPTGQSSPFPAPGVADDEDVRRSSAKSRRGSSGKKSSREVLVDPITVDVSPSARYAQKTATEGLTGSPPRRDLHRQHSVPVDNYTRPIPAMARSATYDHSDPRGRDRSRLQPQVSLESDSDEDYERRHRERRHRKKHRSPEPRAEHHTYNVEGAHAIPMQKYSRSYEMQMPVEQFTYYPPNHPGVRVEHREASGSYRSSTTDYSGVPFKVKTSKTYDVGDVSYSSHYAQQRYEEYVGYPSYA